MKIDSMKVIPMGKIVGGQDGAIYGKYLFRIEHNGDMTVYDMDTFAGTEDPKQRIDFLKLDKAELICPHSNSVMFGNEFYEEGDEFPLLYSNVYNNYAKAERKLKGVCCVYRVTRGGEKFATELVQIIEIGFVEDASLWKMSAEGDGKRPYGNFTIDVDKNIYYGFVMREAAEGTRYFAFDLPRARDGVTDEEFGVKKVVLTPADIKYYFDCEHHRYVQGACCHKSLIYSLEGFNNNEAHPPYLRVIDPAEKKQIFSADLRNYGSLEEPEFIDFRGDVCYYVDVRGNMFVFEFEFE